MGIVKSVQPYWRLAIITMQMMPMISWVQRVASETRSAGRSVCDMAVIGLILALAFGPLRVCTIVRVQRTGQSRPRNRTFGTLLEFRGIGVARCGKFARGMSALGHERRNSSWATSPLNISIADIGERHDILEQPMIRTPVCELLGIEH